MGTLVSGAGVHLSLKIDLPTGATIVCTFGIALILMAACRGFVRRALPSFYGDAHGQSGPAIENAGRVK
jgi:hypothetical protein